ncbi:DUF3185 family protein [Thalassotalea agarivorans]|uniref:Uncharacterized protein n=1 Tax=Thalassotalea agarivorans TaxID=349064 RepID=A0A1I0EDU5_THASX|nr:DUF3185 family protein [Thalassotalea agarivorans]SET42617.1 Protein of unknown function [Thalassotalea agarivorans]
MNKRVIGIILIIVGVALAYWGYDLYESAGSQMTRAFDGDAPLEAWAAMIGGILLVLFGIGKVK